MCLVASPLEKTERRRAPWQSNALLSGGQEHFFLPFRKAGERRCLETECVTGVLRRVQLSFPTVDHDEVGKRTLFVLPSRQVSRYNLVYGGHVIVRARSADLESTVFTSLGPPRLEPNELSYRITSLVG